MASWFFHGFEFTLGALCAAGFVAFCVVCLFVGGGLTLGVIDVITKRPKKGKP